MPGRYSEVPKVGDELVAVLNVKELFE